MLVLMLTRVLNAPVKRSYGQTSGGPSSSSSPAPVGPYGGPQQPYQTTAVAGKSAVPPLPPGPPPPPPSSGTSNPYQSAPMGGQYNYAYTPAPPSQTAAHPQYPGYGYGGQAPGYLPYPNAQGSTPGTPYAGGYPNQNYTGYPVAPTAGQPAYPPYPQPAGPYPSYPGAAPGTPGPPPIAGQQIGVPSPQGVPPPYKRTRYDSMGNITQAGPSQPAGPPPIMGIPQGPQTGPPPALPPVGGNFVGSGDRGRGRGGNYGGGGGRGGPPIGRGGGYAGGPPLQQQNGPMGNFGGGGTGGGAAGGGGAGGYAQQPYAMGSPGAPVQPSQNMGGVPSGGPMMMGGAGNGPSFRGGGNNSPNGPRGGMQGGSRPTLPFNRPNHNQPVFNNHGGHNGPRNAGGGTGFGARGGRPLSGLPGRGGYGGVNNHGGHHGPAFAPSGPSGHAIGRSGPEKGGAGSVAGGNRNVSDNLPKGPRVGGVRSSGALGHRGNSDANSRESKKERKWGSGNKEYNTDGANSSGRKDDPLAAKKTLTDFRISGLAVPEIEWEWKTEKVKKAVKQLVQSAEKKEKQKKAAEREKKTPSAASTSPSAPADSAATSEEEGKPTTTHTSNPIESGVKQEDNEIRDTKEETKECEAPDKVEVNEEKLVKEEIEETTELKKEENLAKASPTEEKYTGALSSAIKAEPTNSLTTSGDMSIDAIGGDEITGAEVDAPPADAPDATTSTTPKKKLSKKQKAAARKSAQKAKAEEEAAGTFDGEARGAAETDGAKPSHNTLSSELPESNMATSAKGKHGRDEDEGDTGAATPDVTAKKVKADRKNSNGDSIDIQMVDENVSNSTSASRSSSTTGKRPPTGPAAEERGEAVNQQHSEAGTPAVSISSRENSRLRIYFCSPISYTSTYSTQGQAPSTTAGGKAAKSTIPNGNTIEARKEAPSVPISEDVDGEPVAVSIPEKIAYEDSERGGVDSDDEDEVIQLSLLAVKERAAIANSDQSQIKNQQDPPATETADEGQVDGTKEETILNEPNTVSAVDDEAATKPLLDHRTIPGLDASDSSYPPNPYGLDEPQFDGAPSVAEILPPEPSADRISISYARNTRRMVLDADIVEKVTINRAEGKIELLVSVQPAVLGEGENRQIDDFRVCRGVLVEALDVVADDYIVIDRASLEQAWGIDHSTEPKPNKDDTAGTSVLDPLLPPLHNLISKADKREVESGLTFAPSFSKDRITIIAYVDRSNPLTEARWVKTGDVDGWIMSIALAQGQDPKKEPLSEWKGKIHVSDPDPPPTIQHALSSWSTSSTVGSLQDRKDFISGHMSDMDNVMEILLRLTRGERGGSSSSSHHAYNNAAPPAQPASVGALAATLSAPYAEHQTQVSLAVLAMFRLSVETAQKAGIPREEVEKQVSDIIQSIPYHLIFKAVDGIFREEQRVKHVAERKAR